ncbi:hypothetical protein R1flu_019457 [Riccia fluitans]|uniref:Histone-lysine N-methyltransferase n=1 Tax=Riccia fluitans TaxID=41844 RepID=A0ABD1ZIQ2_9MARC
MAGDSGEGGGGEQQNSRTGWGIYDRLKKVPRFSKDVTLRGRKVDVPETASESATRRMVEDLFKQEADAAEPLGDFVQIERNEITHRRPKRQEEAEITVCECVIEQENPESPCGDQCLNMMTCTECTPGFCPSKDLCRNQRFQRCQYAQTKLVKTETRGWGLAAAQDLKAGDFVIEYCGEVIPVKEAFQRAKAYETAGRSCWYLINLNGGEYIDSIQSGNLARFINHSCDPNCETVKWSVLGEERIGIFATKDIVAGTELTYDYKPTWYGGARMRCSCGATSCTGFFGTKSKAFQIYMREGAPFGKDAYTWEDEDERLDVEEAELIDDTEDDAPLSAFIDPTFIGKRNRTGHITNAKNAGTVTKVTAEKSPVSGGTGTSPKKEMTASVEAQPAPVAGPSNNPSETSAPVSRRVSILKKDKLKAQHVLGRFKESSKKKAIKAYVAPNSTKPEAQADKEPKKDQESRHSKKKVRFDDDEPPGEKKLVDVSMFKRARTVINELLLSEIPESYPISEAACTEVEFAQELAMSTESDLKKICEEIGPAVKQFYRRDESTSEEVPAPRNEEEKWIEARCKHLRNLLNFHHSIAWTLCRLSLTSSANPTMHARNGCTSPIVIYELVVSSIRFFRWIR